MDQTAILVIVVVAVIILALIVGPVARRRQRAKDFKERYGEEFDRTVQEQGDEDKAIHVLDERQKHVNSLDIQPLSPADRQRYRDEWAAIQRKFVDNPNQAIFDADRAIVEVMQARGYPMTDFDQRAADISVTHPNVVNNYRSARDIAVKANHQQANTEELRQAMIYYRSLFSELVGTEAAHTKEKV